MNITSFIAGTANLVKLSSFTKELSRRNVQHTIIDMGVYTDEYHERLFEELRIQRPDYILNTRASSYLLSLQSTINKLNKILPSIKPDVFVVFGDLNGIIPACISASQLNIPIAHIEAGLRNGDAYDIEEFNRILADKFSSYHFTISKQGTKNLLREGLGGNDIVCAGNTIIDSLVNYLPLANDDFIGKFGLTKQNYGLCALHRELNLNSRKKLKGILEGLYILQQKTKIIVLVYSSTQKALRRNKLFNLLSEMKNVILTNRHGYVNYLSLLKNAKFVITDSSGLQDECAYLDIPCLTCLEVTHRSDALSAGKGILVGTLPSQIKEGYESIFSKNRENKLSLDWDGLAAKRIAEHLIKASE